jgi:hypothetical protein
MKSNLESYVKTYKDFLTIDECDAIVEQSKNLVWEKHSYQDPVTKEFITSGDTELDNVWPNSSFEYKDIIMQRLWYAIREYIEDLNFSWFNSWQGFMDIRLNKYNENNKMNNHCDHIHTLFDGNARGIPILTILGSLNDDYQGGKFIMWEDKEVTINKGELIIFPSNFLYPHRVETITKGTRYTFVSWVW